MGGTKEPTDERRGERKSLEKSDSQSKLVFKFLIRGVEEDGERSMDVLSSYPTSFHVNGAIWWGEDEESLGAITSFIADYRAS